MESTQVWSEGPVGGDAAASDGLLRLLDGAGDGAAARAAAGDGGDERRIATGPVICPYCRWDRFEVVSQECFCEGCCLPLEVHDEEGFGGAEPEGRELRPPTAPAPGTDTAMVVCPAGHDLFQVAAAYTLGPDGHMRRLSVGLRCPVDGALSLLVDDVRMEPDVSR